MNTWMPIGEQTRPQILYQKCCYNDYMQLTCYVHACTCCIGLNYNFGCHLWVHCGRAFRIHSSLEATSIWSLSTPENLFCLQWRTNVYTIAVACVNLCFETLLWVLECINLKSSSKCSWTKVLFHLPFITNLPLPVISIVSRQLRLHCTDQPPCQLMRPGG